MKKKISVFILLFITVIGFSSCNRDVSNKNEFVLLLADFSETYSEDEIQNKLLVLGDNDLLSSNNYLAYPFTFDEDGLILNHPNKEIEGRNILEIVPSLSEEIIFGIIKGVEVHEYVYDGNRKMLYISKKNNLFIAISQTIHK